MKPPSLIKKDYLTLIVFLAAVVFVITAFNSHGYYHADEHYQIIEFAGLKLGTHAPNELAWEYKAKIRPALQPAICFAVLKVLNSLNLTDPYLQTFILRLISSLLALSIITYFVLKTRNSIDGKTNKIIYYSLSFFLWFIPYISVRFSSETWSGLLFLLSIAVLLSKSPTNHKPFVAGFLSGLSFLFRFQIAFAVLGFILWLIFVDRVKIKSLSKFFVSLVTALLLGFLADRWFYGEFVFTPWNYFVSVIESGGNGFGTSPWYFYMLKLLTYPGYFIGIPLLLAFISLLIFNPRSFLLWCTIPFIIVHSFIPHKEERFLFPVVFLFPLILMEGYLFIRKNLRGSFNSKIPWYLMLVIFIGLNSVGLIALALKSAGIGRMEITRHIHKNYQNKPVNLIFCKWANPYNPWNSLPVKFYLQDCLNFQNINKLCDLHDSLFVDGATNLLVIRKSDKNRADCLNELKIYNFRFEKQSIPKWVESINYRFKGFDNGEILELYSLQNH